MLGWSYKINGTKNYPNHITTDTPDHHHHHHLHVENYDMSTFIFQLTSYDTNDNIIDSILLDARFRFEIMYWNNFKIDKDGKIFIVMYQQEVHNYSEDNFNVSGKVNSVKLEYEMGNDGVFKQIK